MSGRLTDSALEELWRIASLERLPGDSPRDILARRDSAARHYFVNVVHELREHRAAALSPADVEALEFASDYVSAAGACSDRESFRTWCERAESVLARLIVQARKSAEPKGDRND